MSNPTCLAILVILHSSCSLPNNVQLSPSSPEHLQLSRLVRDILEFYFPGCSLGIGKDYPGMSRAVEKVVVWQHGRYLPMAVNRMDRFEFDYRRYPWVWRPEHLLSFRTQPPEMRSLLTLGGACALNLFMATSATRVPQLVMHTAALYKVRNMYDPFLIHVHGHATGAPDLLFNDPVRGITTKLVSRYDPVKGNTVVHNLCHYCDAGEHRLNPPVRYTGARLGLERLYPRVPLTMNGRRVRYGHIEVVDMEDARARRERGEDLSLVEEGLFLVEGAINATTDVILPEMSPNDFFPNGSLAGVNRQMLAGDLDVMVITLYSEISARAISLTNPFLFFHGTFVTRIPRLDIKWYAVVKPFSPTLWMTLVFSMLLCAFTIYALERAEGRRSNDPKTKVTGTKLYGYPTGWYGWYGRVPERRNLGGYRRFRRSLSEMSSYLKMLVRILLEQSMFPIHRSNSVNLFMTMFFYFATIMACLYRTKLVSYITFPPTEHLPETGAELKRSRFKWGCISLVSMLAALLLKDAPSDHPTVDLANKAEIIPTMQDCMERTLHEDFACLMVDHLYLRERNYFMDSKGNLKIVQSPARLLSVYFGTGHSRDCIEISNANWMTFQLIESHVLDKMESHINFRDFIKYYYRRTKEKEVGQESLLNLDRLASAFFFWLFGLALAVLAFAIELVQRKKEPMVFLK